MVVCEAVFATIYLILSHFPFSHSPPRILLNAQFDFFAEETCTTESTTSYYELTGQQIPYSTGLGLYQDATKCASYNDDGELEAKEVCQNLLENVIYRCDATYQGGCETIEALEAELKASDEEEAKGCPELSPQQLRGGVRKRRSGYEMPVV